MSDISRQASEPENPPGTLVLVVGASGAGKDTLIAGARAALAGNPRIVFPQRHITRPENAGGEDHVAVAPEVFAPADYALAWEAHGHRYGIPAAIDVDLSYGRSVVTNVSRTVIEAARRQFDRCAVVNVTVDPSVLRARLAGRGRESADEIEARLARAAAYDVTGPDVTEIDNNGSTEDAIRRFADFLLSLTSDSIRP
jgi:ribose 1,5-bisphosphokinase